MDDLVKNNSVEEKPWEHPFLTQNNIQRFRKYSLAIRDAGLLYADEVDKPLDVAFCINLAQNCYKWARMVDQTDSKATLYLHEWDERALTHPEWEEFDGEWANVLDGNGFREAHPDLQPDVAVEVPKLDAFCDFAEAWREFTKGNRRPFFKLQQRYPTLRFDSLPAYDGLYAYLLPWAVKLLQHDVSCSAYFPVPAYFSGKPYCAFATGDDLQYDCGRGDDLGQLVSMAFNGARFLWLSNPHALGHCRRLGLVNGVYLPYPMDDKRYCPGIGRARAQWEANYGPGFYVLSTARLDDKVKGNTDSLFKVLASLVRRKPEIKFVFLAWGHSAESFAQRIEQGGLQKNFILLSPVGKKRLVDYYRSCDCVLDQFVYGYYGATGLEACSVGKPVVMRIRSEQYAPLYGGDVAPMLNCRSPRDAANAVENLARYPDYCARIGKLTREWLVRTHGEEVTLKWMMGLLHMTHSGHVPELDIENPLCDELTEEEIAYHQSRLQMIKEETPKAA